MELKKCPFCGGKAEISYRMGWGGAIYTVYCSDCGAMIPYQDTRETAAAMWNHRKEAEQ